MNKYVVIDEENYGDSWVEEYDTLEEANREAKHTWELFTDLERRNRKVYVMRSIGEPDDTPYNLEDVDGAFFSEHHILREQVYDVADSLYGGGWRAEDKDDLKAEYGMDDESLERVCECLAEIEKSSTWYAVQETPEDPWDFGSHDKREAIEMMLSDSKYNLICIVNDITNVAIGEIRRDDCV